MNRIDKGSALWYVSSLSMFALSAAQQPLRQIISVNDIIALFPNDPACITVRAEQALQEATALREVIIAVPASERTFANTVQALDFLTSQSDLAIMQGVASILEKVHPDDAVRATAQRVQLDIGTFMIDKIATDSELYRVMVEYAQHNAPTEVLSDLQKMVLRDTLKAYELSGLQLSAVQQEQVRSISKQLQELCLQFERNVAHDQCSIIATREELAGVAEDIIASFATHEDGSYRVGVDYPSYVAVMTTCTVEETRKRLASAYNNRAYPENEGVLKAIIAARHELATCLGYVSYAALNLVDSMASTPEVAESFLRSLLAKVLQKEEQELADLVMTTTPQPIRARFDTDGTIAAWNLPFLSAEYAKAQIGLDERALAEYFPMDSTIPRLLDLYRTFFGLEFAELPIEGLWHEEVRLIAVTEASTQYLLGYLLLDLHPRPNKYTHACHRTIVPAVTDAALVAPPKALSIVLANFPRATATRPALWQRTHDVSTFFHEFGHALHALLGRTELAGVSGTNVVRDFVEMPSQMLEEWLYDTEVLKRLSCHYKTGEPLSDELIVRIQRARCLDSGSWARGQIMYALLSLAYYAAGADKDLYQIMRDIQAETSRKIVYDPASHFYASFLHLTGYAAQYYGYLWSKVFAVDLFAEIEKEGLFNPEAGARYVREVISHGGSKDPNELLVAFLGREPRQDAFLQRYGFINTD